MSKGLESYILSQNNWIRASQHLTFWLVHLLMFSLMSVEGYWMSLTYIGMTLPFKMIIVYPVLYLLFPKFLLQRKYLLFVGLTAIIVIAATLLQHSIFSQMENDTAPLKVQIVRLLSQVLIALYLLFLALGLKFMKYVQRREQVIQELTRSQLEAELKFLKAQIHPHFLFNTLNNLYTLALQKSDKAPLVIEKLSELLRYMSYDAIGNSVFLESEVDYLRNYAALEKIRYGKKLDLSFVIEGPVKGEKIAPLILLPFVENSFKHGASGRIESSWITIYICSEEGELTMKVENNISQESDDQMGYREGIGLKNVRRRLELLYKEKFDLTIVKGKDTHLVTLRINLR